MTKKKIILAVVAMSALATWYFVGKHNAVGAADGDAVVVKAEKIHTSNLPLEVTAIGSLVAKSVEITPEEAGHVQKILFVDGSFVKQGDVLIQLDDAIYRAKNASAKAQLAYSEMDYKRKAQLGKTGAIAKQAIDAADADLKEKRASADESAVMVSKMALTAPFDGVVGKSKVNPGDYVTTGASLVTITDTKHLHIEYNVPEKYLPLLKLGQEVKVTTATFANKTFTGKVAYIAPTINTDNRSVSIYAEVPNPANQLAAGMFVDVSQSLGANQNALMVPARSLVPVMDGEQVYKVVDGKAYAVNVLIGKRNGESVEITQGLAPGDVVVTDGQLKIRNNMPVKIKS